MTEQNGKPPLDEVNEASTPESTIPKTGAEASAAKPRAVRGPRVHHRQDLPDDVAKIERDEMFDIDPERDKKLPRRRLARERVMQLLYSAHINERDIDQLFFEMIKQDPEADDQMVEFARELTLQISAHADEVNALISEHLKHWDFTRIAMIDRLLIQIGISELLYFPDIPPKATINELIEIAKDYSTEESGKFINGVLHAVMSELQSTGKMQKAGRGLIDRSL